MNLFHPPHRSAESRSARLSIGLVFLTVALAAAAEPTNYDRLVTPAPGWDNLAPVTARATDWPWWRGPNLNNHAAPGANPPVHWSTNENVRWRSVLPGKGHASPCIWGGRIFLPAADAQQERIWMVCLERATGKQLWQTELYHGPLAKLHENNSYASATPACDGERVYFPYQTAEAICLAAVDLAGKVVWTQEVSPYKSVQGFSASPALYHSLVIIPTDGSTGNELSALHRRTGRLVWRVPLRKVLENYASPLAVRVAGRDQLLLLGGVNTHSFDPNDGRLLWECAGPAQFCAATAVFDSQVVYATGGYPEKALLAIRADGAGDITASNLLWKSDAKAGYVPSPLLDGGLLYAVNDNGLMRCYQAADGTVVWEQNLGGLFYSSPVLAGERLYLFDRKGKGHVLKAGRQFESLATNELPAGVFSTPVILGDCIYLRTLGDMYCLGTTGQ